MTPAEAKDASEDGAATSVDNAIIALAAPAADTADAVAGEALAAAVTSTAAAPAPAPAAAAAPAADPVELPVPPYDYTCVVMLPRQLTALVGQTMADFLASPEVDAPFGNASVREDFIILCPDYFECFVKLQAPPESCASVSHLMARYSLGCHYGSGPAACTTAFMTYLIRGKGVAVDEAHTLTHAIGTIMNRLNPIGGHDTGNVFPL
jgi:hypothetical protein